MIKGLKLAFCQSSTRQVSESAQLVYILLTSLILDCGYQGFVCPNLTLFQKGEVARGAAGFLRKNVIENAFKFQNLFMVIRRSESLPTALKLLGRMLLTFNKTHQNTLGLTDA